MSCLHRAVLALVLAAALPFGPCVFADAQSPDAQTTPAAPAAAPDTAPPDTDTDNDSANQHKGDEILTPPHDVPFTFSHTAPTNPPVPRGVGLDGKPLQPDNIVSLFRCDANGELLDASGAPLGDGAGPRRGRFYDRNGLLDVGVPPVTQVILSDALNENNPLYLMALPKKRNPFETYVFSIYRGGYRTFHSTRLLCGPPQRITAPGQLTGGNAATLISLFPASKTDPDSVQDGGLISQPGYEGKLFVWGVRDDQPGPPAAVQIVDPKAMAPTH